MEQEWQNDAGALTAQAIPQKDVEQACFHALGLVGRNCEYLEQHLARVGADEQTRQAVNDISAAAESENLSDAQDVARIYDVIAREMAQPSKLIETVAARMLSAVEEEFSCLENVRITLSKCSPALAGPAEYSRISVQGGRRNSGRTAEEEEELYNGE